MSMLTSTTTQQNQDMIMDEFRDEGGIDTATSTNESYDSADFYTNSTVEADIDSNTVLMIHADEANGTAGTDIDDASDSDHTITANGHAATSNAQTKFDNTLKFDGTGDYLSLADHADWFFSTNDFTIDFWVYSSDLDESIIWQQTSDQIKWSSSNTGVLQIVIGGANFETDTALSANTWYHVMVARNSTTINVYIDGVNDGTNVDGTQVNHSSIMTIGANNAGNLPFTGYIDEFRISNGVEQQTGNFTAPTAPYTSASATYDTTLISNTTVAESQPDQANIVMLVENSTTTPTLNTDIKAWATRAGDSAYVTSNWTQITLTDEGHGLKDMD